MIFKLSKRRHRVSMHTVPGTTIEGILLGRARGCYVLASASIARDEDDSFVMAGQINIPREQVLFYQDLDR